MDLKKILPVASILFFCYIPLKATSGSENEPGDKWVTFKGTSTLTGYLSNRQGFGQEIPSQYLTWIFRGQLTLAGIPLNGSALISTLQHPGYQPMNHYTLQVDTRAILQHGIPKPAFRFLRYFEVLEVGRTRPEYSKLMLSGIMLQGAHAGVRFGRLSLAAACGTSQQPVSNGFLWSQQYRQRMYFGRIGFGHYNQSSFYLSALRYRDIPESHSGDTHFYVQRPDTFIHIADTFFIPGDTIPLIQHPGEGLVVGLESAASLFNRRLQIGGELSGCANTGNTSSEPVATEAMPAWVSSVFQPRLSTSLSYAARIHGNLNLQYAKVRVTAMRVAPGYRSAGVPFMRQDYEGIEVQVTAMLLKKRLMVQPWVRLYRDNLSGLKAITTTTDIRGVTAFWRPNKLPWVSVTWSPHRQQAKHESMLQQSTAGILTVAGGKNYLLAKEYNAYTGITWSGQQMEIRLSDIITRYRGRQLMVQQSVMLKMPLSLQLSGGYYSLHTDTLRQVSGTASIGGAYHHPKKWRLGVALRYTGNPDQKRTGLAANFSADMGKAGRLTIVAEPILYRDLLRPDREFNQYIVRCSWVTRL
jgi:hypothetical protein